MFCFVSHGYTSISQGNYLYNLSIQFMFMLGNYNNHTIAPMSVNISDPVVPPWKYAETSKIEIFYFWRFGIFSWRPYWKWPIWPISPSICNRKHVPSGRTEKKMPYNKRCFGGYVGCSSIRYRVVQQVNAILRERVIRRQSSDFPIPGWRYHTQYMRDAADNVELFACWSYWEAQAYIYIWYQLPTLSWRRKPTPWKTRTPLPYKANGMAAEDLVPQGARAFTTVTLRWCPRTISATALKGLMHVIIIFFSSKMIATLLHGIQRGYQRVVIFRSSD